MTPRTALIVAIVAGTASVAVVAVDSVLGLEATLEHRENGEWRAIWDAPGRSGETRYEAVRFPAFGCASPEMRLTVDNNKPIPDTVRVSAGYSDDRRGVQQRIFEETWSLGAFEVREHLFTVPRDALPPPEPQPRGGLPTQRPAQITVDVESLGTHWTCVAFPEVES